MSGGGERRRVLLADDSAIIGKQLGAILQNSQEFTIVGRASNGAEAIRLYSDLRPDLVCLDVIMPVLDGLKALSAILHKDATANIVMVTSLGAVADRVNEALTLGAKAVIAKPFQPEQVLRTLREI